MAVVAPILASKPNNPNYHFATITSLLTPSFHPKKKTQILLKHNLTRRSVSFTALFGSLLSVKNAFFDSEKANAFEFGITTPDQTVEEAESGIRNHAKSLLQVKELLESSPPESWKEAQKALRKSAGYLKLDIYTIIQSRPGSDRAELRKLYSSLFNSVSKLDYAARDKDGTRVWECYGNIVVALNDILSRI